MIEPGKHQYQHLPVFVVLLLLLLPVGYMGCALCLVLGNVGAAIGTYKSSLGIFSMSINTPEGIVKNM